MSKLVEETVHAQLGPGPLERGSDGLITHCIAYVLYRQAPADDAVWDLTVNFSPNIIRQQHARTSESVCFVSRHVLPSRHGLLF